MEEFVTGETSRVSEERDCGYGGWLCDMCREDRADARTARLVEGLALAGLLGNPEIGAQAAENEGVGKELLRVVLHWAAALREREGGK